MAVKRARRARATEHEEQSALMRWAAAHERHMPELTMLYAIPNGGHRHLSVAMELKAEGVKPGVPDLHLPVPRGKWHGLWIEMKAKGGKTSEAQRDWIGRLLSHGHCAVVCIGWEAARDVILEYLSE